MVKFLDAARNKPIVGITMGDPAGIGPEICAKAITSPETQFAANCLIIGDKKAMRQGLKAANLSNIEINPIKKVTEAKFLRGTIDVLDLGNVDISRLKMGQVSKAAGKAAVEYLEKAISLAIKGKYLLENLFNSPCLSGSNFSSITITSPCVKE